MTCAKSKNGLVFISIYVQTTHQKNTCKNCETDFDIKVKGKRLSVCYLAKISLNILYLESRLYTNS